MIKITRRIAASRGIASVKAPGELYEITDTLNQRVHLSFLFRITDDRSSLFASDRVNRNEAMVYVRRLPEDKHNPRQARQYLADKALHKLKIPQQFRAKLRLAFMMSHPDAFGSPFLFDPLGNSNQTPVIKLKNDSELKSTILRTQHRFYIRRDIAFKEVERLISDIKQKLVQIDHIIQNSNKDAK